MCVCVCGEIGSTDISSRSWKNVSGSVHPWHFVCEPRHRLPSCSALMPIFRDGGECEEGVDG